MKKSIVFSLGISVFSFINAQDVSVSGPFEIEGGWSNEVVTAEGKTEYVVAFTDTSTPHSFTVPSGVYSMEYLVVAGGGGGGYYHGGGGGGGGMIEETSSVSPNQEIEIKVGDGGAGGVKHGLGSIRGSNGGDSYIAFGLRKVTSYGGGGGGGIYNDANLKDLFGGADGGSGGGGAGTAAGASRSYPAPGGNGFEGQGNNGYGRVAMGGNSRGYGGGGAGAPATGFSGGNGRKSSITGTEIYYGGGGGGAGYSSTYNSSGSGGLGGGGDGGGGTSDKKIGYATVGNPGTNGLGGGGGGGHASKDGGAGGSGIVILRYAKVDVSSGIIISSFGGSYGTPVPAYGAYEEIPANEYSCQEYVQVEDGVRAYCTGWKLYGSSGELIRSSGTLAEGETNLKAILDSSCAGSTLEWQWELRYLVTIEKDREGTFNVSTGYYSSGTLMTIVATPGFNYSLGKWQKDGVDLENTSNEYAFTVESKPTTIKAFFIPSGITVSYDGFAINGSLEDHFASYSSVGSTYTLYAPEFTEVTETIRQHCVGYTLTSFSTGVTSEVFPVSEAQNGNVSASVQFEEPVLLTWKWREEYYVSTVVEGNGALKENKSGWYKTGDEITLEVASTVGFKGWGGFFSGGCPSEAQAEVVVKNKPIVATAYFTQNIKDNLVLNGDFEQHVEYISQLDVIGSLRLLNAGSWNIEQNAGSSYFVCGIISSHNNLSYGTNIRSYGLTGLSLQLTTLYDGDEGCVSCDVNPHCGGLYTFSCMLVRGANTSNIANNEWKVKVELVDKNNSDRIISIGEFDVKDIGQSNWKSQVQQFNIPKGGAYKLKFTIPKESRIGTYNTLSMGLDNISLCLDKRCGFALMVR